MASLLVLGLALATWFFPYAGPLLKLKPVHFSAPSATGLHAPASLPPASPTAPSDPDPLADAVNLANLDAPLLAPSARRSARERQPDGDLLRNEDVDLARAEGRIVTVEGYAWTEFLTTVARAIRDPDTVPAYTAQVADAGLGVHKSIFFRPEVAPLNALASRFATAVPSSVLLLNSPDADRADLPAWVEVLAVPGGMLSGEESGVRGEYDFRVSWRVPEGLRFPYRQHTWPLAAFAVFLWSLPALARTVGLLRDGAPLPDGFYNSQTVIARRCVIAGGVGVALLFAPLAIKGTDGGFALALVGLVVGLTGFICAVIFGRAAGRLQRLASGEGVLAHWVCESAAWDAFCTAEFATQRGDKRILFYLVLGISSMVCGLFAFLDHRVIGVMLGLFLGLNLLCGWLAWAAPRWEDARRRRTLTPLCLLGETGVYLAGTAHMWTSFGSRFESIAWVEVAGLPCLQLTYSLRARYWRQTVEVRVPVPPEARADAERAVERLQVIPGSV